jgi:hypothetical protein
MKAGKKMGKYIIAGFKTEFEPRYDFLRERAKPYAADFDDSETDFKVFVSEEYLQKRFEESPYLPIDRHEYLWVGQGFYDHMIERDGVMLHSSCVEKDGYAYLFSANCGTGKSTHTHLWLKNLPGTRIINDDKPLLLKENDTWYACGTPFSGKTDENLDVKIPVRAIVFLKRGEENKVSKMPVNEAIKLLFGQTIRPARQERAIKVLESVDSIFRSVPVFSLECNMDDEAAFASYNGIERLINNED